MKKWLLLLLGLVLTGCTAANNQPPSSSPSSSPTPPPEEVVVELPNYGPAPELENEVWLNVDGPLRLADLRGKVVALEMWTFG